jgi:hypothetical protein
MKIKNEKPTRALPFGFSNENNPHLYLVKCEKRSELWVEIE